MPFFVSRGTPIRVLEEARALARRGHRVTLVSYHIGEDLPEEVLSGIDHRRIRKWLFWYKKTEAGANWQKILLDIMLLRKAWSLAFTHHPDVLYAHLHEGVAIGWLVRVLLFWRRIVFVADFHGGLTSEMTSHGYLRSTILFRVFRWVEEWINARGDVAVTSSWENTEIINLSRFGVRPAETLLDGVDISRYASFTNHHKQMLRKKWNISEDEYVFAYTGALISNKGLLPMIDAIGEFCRAHKEGLFILAGFPLAEAQMLCKKQGVAHRVRIISPLDYFDLSEVLLCSDVGIDPKDSSTHQSSGKILQYMGAGLPVVCLNRENNRKFLGRGGVYCEDGGLAEGFWWCMYNKEEAKKKGEGNAERAKELSWDAGATKVERLIAEAGGDPKSSSG